MTAKRLYNSGLYHPDCLKAAIYKFNKIISAKIDLVGDDYICEFTPLNKQLDFDQFFSEFDQELIDQELRREISQKTSEYRNFILSLAFSNTGLQGD